MTFQTMTAITRAELVRIVERSERGERGEDFARRRSPQPSVLAEYFRRRNQQMARVREYMANKTAPSSSPLARSQKPGATE